MKKPRTIDEVCGLPEGSFKEHVANEERELKAQENRRRERIRLFAKNRKPPTQ